MPDYNRYRFEKQITNNDIIATLRPRFPKIHKSTLTMVNNPYDYAVQLLPEAESILVETYGEGHGLSSCKKKNHENKAKPSRLYVRVDDSLMERIKSAMSKMNFATTQDFIEAALVQFVERYGA